MNTYTIFSGPDLIEFIDARTKRRAINTFLVKTGRNEGEVDRVACRKRYRGQRK